MKKTAAWIAGIVSFLMLVAFAAAAPADNSAMKQDETKTGATRTEQGTKTDKKNLSRRNKALLRVNELKQKRKAEAKAGAQDQDEKQNRQTK